MSLSRGIRRLSTLLSRRFLRPILASRPAATALSSAPTEERRRELVKECRDIAEQARVAIRNIRRDFNNKIERDEELTEDEVRREQAKVQKYTDEYIAKIDELFKSKESEVMEI